MKNIEFILSDEQYGWMDKPVPAINAIPEWYRTMPSFNNYNQLMLDGRSTNQTVKRCIPFMEAMTTGYYITLPADVVASKHPETGDSRLNWLTHVDLINTHDVFQTKDLPLSPEYVLVPFKFMNFFQIKTPPGYSCLFVHPLNRFDLPFYSMSGVVDTDKHTPVVHFPFLMKKDYEGIIEKGTPIIQVIPFKREDWQSSTDKVSSYVENHKILEKYFSYATRAYKKIAWSRKTYK